MSADTAARRSTIRQRFMAVDTSNVADVLDQLGHLDYGLSAAFLPYPATAGRLAGWAYTIRGQMVPYDGTGDAAKMQACAGISSDEVSVWSGDGDGICYFGELIALGMQERGSVGALVDGGIRDVRWLGEHGFTVYARYRTPVQSIGRWRVTGCQERVYIAGATTPRVAVDPGDFILADDDGAIVIPAALVDTVLARAEELTATEVRIRAELANGLSLSEALQKYGHV
ncbi:MAG TPA: RraA family protein [Candidatus Lustribacter sp.]